MQWTPDPNSDMARSAQPMAQVDKNGHILHEHGRASAGNRLIGHPNPIIDRIGKFCLSEPALLPDGMGSFAGILVGMYIAHKYPHLVEDIIIGLNDVHPEGTWDNPAVDFAQAIVEGVDKNGEAL